MIQLEEVGQDIFLDLCEEISCEFEYQSINQFRKRLRVQQSLIILVLY
jgi:hypothetical protein